MRLMIKILAHAGAFILMILAFLGIGTWSSCAAKNKAPGSHETRNLIWKTGPSPGEVLPEKPRTRAELMVTELLTPPPSIHDGE